MNYKFIATTIILTLPITTFGAITIGTVDLTQGQFEPDDYYVYTEITDPSGAIGAGWSFDSIDLETFVVQDYTIGFDFTFVSLPFGTPISAGLGLPGSIISSNVSPPEPPATFQIPEGESSYFGFEFAGRYGWAELTNESGVVSIASSATAFSEPGIIVGTTTAVPEPASTTLFFAASLFLKRRR